MAHPSRSDGWGHDDRAPKSSESRWTLRASAWLDGLWNVGSERRGSASCLQSSRPHALLSQSMGHPTLPGGEGWSEALPPNEGGIEGGSSEGGGDNPPLPSEGEGWGEGGGTSSMSAPSSFMQTLQLTTWYYYNSLGSVTRIVSKPPSGSDLPPNYVPVAMRVSEGWNDPSLACWGGRSVAEPVPAGAAPTSLPTPAANAAGVWYPSELCGRR